MHIVVSLVGFKVLEIFYTYTSIHFSFFVFLFAKLSQQQKHIQISLVIQKKKNLTLSGWVEGKKATFCQSFVFQQLDSLLPW